MFDVFVQDPKFSFEILKSTLSKHIDISRRQSDERMAKWPPRDLFRWFVCRLSGHLDTTDMTAARVLMYIYIYIERERDRERERYTYTCMYIYIYIYI